MTQCERKFYDMSAIKLPDKRAYCCDDTWNLCGFLQVSISAHYAACSFDDVCATNDKGRSFESWFSKPLKQYCRSSDVTYLVSQSARGESLKPHSDERRVWIHWMMKEGSSKARRKSQTLIQGKRNGKRRYRFVKVATNEKLVFTVWCCQRYEDVYFRITIRRNLCGYS